MDIGRPGTFDDNGVAVTSIVRSESDQLLAYYAGFEVGLGVRYRIFTGLAVSEDDGVSFERVSEAPILDRSDTELMFRCGPFVLRDESRYRMWYVAGSDWTEVGAKIAPVYDLRYAESSDGISWPRTGSKSLGYNSTTEHGLGRPWVLIEDDHYKLFFSARSRQRGTYTPGYAESSDGLRWTRLDQRLGLWPTPSSFDAGGLMYLATIRTQSDLWCFYNGENFGEAGFGAARLLR